MDGSRRVFRCHGFGRSRGCHVRVDERGRFWNEFFLVGLLYRKYPWLDGRNIGVMLFDWCRIFDCDSNWFVANHEWRSDRHGGFFIFDLVSRKLRQCGGPGLQHFTALGIWLSAALLLEPFLCRPIPYPRP